MNLSIFHFFKAERQLKAEIKNCYWQQSISDSGCRPVYNYHDCGQAGAWQHCTAQLIMMQSLISLRIHTFHYVCTVCVHSVHSGGGSGSRGGTIIIISSLCHVDTRHTFARRRRRPMSPFHLYSSVDDYREVKDSEFFRISLS